MAFAEVDTAPPSASAPQPDSLALLEALKAREAAVASKEAAMATREAAVAEATQQVTAQLDELKGVETRLAELVTRIDSAAKEDVDRLTAVYAAMKPKDAAALFTEMTPEFAAGFLAGMKPDQAAAIISQIDPKIAYGFSVVLAGRQADLKRQAEALLK